MTRLTEHRPDNGHDASRLPLRMADFDVICPVVDLTPGVVKRAATATVRRVVDGRDEQQLLLRMLYEKFPRRPVGTVEQAAAAKRGRPAPRSGGQA